MPYEIVDLPKAQKDYLRWAKSDRRMIDKIDELVEDMKSDPYTGIGKPEQLKYDFAGFWSRRITEQHRLLY
ncbi:MAG: Txe/YoeB family addiction module toxin [Holophagaceae bacterium]|nr:Txe/YoeB family addiction module toxin [Holophagaceae bacterium]